MLGAVELPRLQTGEPNGAAVGVQHQLPVGRVPSFKRHHMNGVARHWLGGAMADQHGTFSATLSRQDRAYVCQQMQLVTRRKRVLEKLAIDVDERDDIALAFADLGFEPCRRQSASLDACLT